MNNTIQIRDFLRFENPGDFYFIQLIKRRKENPEMKVGNKAIQDFYVGSLDYYDRKVPEMIQMADFYNARVCIRLNRRNSKKLALKTISDIANKIESEQYESVKNSYASAAGKYMSESDKSWILDIDEENLKPGLMSEIKTFIKNLSPAGNKQKMIIPSKTGYHMIVSPFDSREFCKLYPEIEIKKDSPTNLYIP